jgi:hypothetical protein
MSSQRWPMGERGSVPASNNHFSCPFGSFDVEEEKQRKRMERTLKNQKNSKTINSQL